MLLALTTVVTMAGQDKKSDRVVSIDGTKYYLHTVQPKETLYSLSRTYGLAIEDIQANNEGMEMLKAGEVESRRRKPLRDSSRNTRWLGTILCIR